ncbi:unnamed protein product [Arctia plantaginis]|uniref:Uncharacterized protein n=1 Tax=Arctia plantaginis TaxID=874455 RepID=A0A8S1AIY9_ARCPL|nr:unnamed protein product [Arctia plantaginis]
MSPVILRNLNCDTTSTYPGMKALVLFIAALLIGSVPTAESFAYSYDSILDVTDEFFSDDLIIYRAEYDIVDILYPLNGLNKDSFTNNRVYFFTLADFKSGKRIDKGLFININGVATKLLDNGRVSAAAKDHTKEAYFGATDGLYAYDVVKNKAVKYGNFNDPIISLGKVKGEDTIYALTEDNVLYKVTELGTKREKIDHAPNLEDIVLDASNNLYFSTPDKRVHIVGRDGVQQVKGLPEHISYLKIYKAPFFVEDAIAVIANEMSHLVFFNGTVGDGHCKYLVKPTAYSLQPLLLQQYGYKKNIYELNFLNSKTRKSFSGQIKNLVERRADQITKFTAELHTLVDI